MHICLVVGALELLADEGREPVAARQRRPRPRGLDELRHLHGLHRLRAVLVLDCCFFGSGWNALRGALEARGPSYPARGLELSYPEPAGIRTSDVLHLRADP